MTPSGAQKQQDPPAAVGGWRPEPGDVIKGTVVAISRAWSDWSQSYYPLVTVHDETTNRDVDVHAFHHTLLSRLMENKPKVGEAIEITFVGMQRTKDDKRQVAVYRVSLPNATGTEVWDSLESQNAQLAGQAARAQGAQQQAGDDDIPF